MGYLNSAEYKLLGSAHLHPGSSCYTMPSAIRPDGSSDPRHTKGAPHNDTNRSKLSQPKEPPKPVLVLKFGGTSVSSLENWTRIAGIVQQRLTEYDNTVKILIVHSALSGVTDKLQECLAQATERRPSSRGATASGIGPHDNMRATGKHRETLSAIMTKHQELADALGIPYIDAQSLLDPYRNELGRILEGASLISEVSPRTEARVVAMGELMSTSLGAVFLQRILGCDQVVWLEARELLRSQSALRESGPATPQREFLSAQCDADPDEELQYKLSDAVQRVFVTQGFIAANAAGDTVLLGRGGSDTSGSYMASLVMAKRLEIWTDVPGMFTANPRMVPGARMICSLSYDEAHELASTGAKVLHQRCLGPVAKHGIPIMVCDTFRPRLEGTVIGANESHQNPPVVKAISVRHGITTVNLDHGMSGVPGFFANVFTVFKAHGLSVDLVSTSKNSVTVTLDPESIYDSNLKDCAEDLSKICAVKIMSNCATVSLVGAQIRAALASVAPALVIMRDYKVHMMTQAANNLNLTFVVEDGVAETIAKELHNAFFCSKPPSAGCENTFGKSWEALKEAPHDPSGSAGSGRILRGSGSLNDLLCLRTSSSSPESRSNSTSSLTSLMSTPTSSLECLRASKASEAAVMADIPTHGGYPTAKPELKPRVGFVGWRGMVGSVLMQRMAEENDFDGSFEPVFFTTSQVGQLGPPIGDEPASPLMDATDVEALAAMAVVVSCQGGDYTNEVHPKLRAAGWSGFWIDAASALRTSDDAIIVLDPINGPDIQAAITSGVRDLVGGNCTVSLMLMALGGLFENGWVEWLTSMTYQSASGAGARNMRELVQQMAMLGACDKDSSGSSLSLESKVHAVMRSDAFPTEQFGAPLAGSLLPFIDKMMDDGSGRSKEEWKGNYETNKILGTRVKPVIVDGTCVRVGSLRCHSQAITIKLRRDVPMDEIMAAISANNEWVKVVPNTKEATIQELTPGAVSGSLTVAVGRLRKMELGPEYLSCFTVGDQLLWGAAEPVRRALGLVLERVSGRVSPRAGQQPANLIGGGIATAPGKIYTQKVLLA